VSSLCRLCNPEDTRLKILIKISVDYVNLVDNLFRGQGASLMFRKMLNSAPGAMVKHIKIEVLSRNMYIQHFGNVKSYFPNIKSSFYFLFWYA
jgi:hypothetical protein